MATSNAAPPHLPPMLAGGTGAPRDRNGWMFEPKFDGQRIVATVHRGRVTLTNRRGSDATPTFPELAGLSGADALGGRSAVLDGEVVATDERGGPNFQRLQRRMHVADPPPRLLADVPVVYAVFDVLWLDGESLVERPQSARRQVLDSLALRGTAWQTAPVLDAPPGELLQACRDAGLEGFMAKRLDAPYLPGRRSPAWSKVKCIRRREFVVGGWAAGSGSRRSSIGSLALGYFAVPDVDDRLVYVGQAGSGLTEDLLGQLRGLFTATGRPTSPFAGPVPRGLSFVEPELVVEVAFTEVTESGTLRQPSIKGVRPDLRAAGVTADEELRR
ncbi:MAG: non-homologous end-joining DNA ligase [Acidimicrobiales bacterium]